MRRRSPALLTVLCCLAALGAGPSSADAQQPVPRAITAADRETARALMDEGDSKLGKSDLRGALDAYLAADRIMAVPTTGLEVGKTQARLGMLLEARDTLLRVTRYPQDPNEPAAYTRARTDAAELAAQLGGRIPSLQIDVAGPADDGTIEASVDGLVLPPGTHRHARKVNPGEKVIRARAPGFRPAEQRISVAEGEQRVVHLTLVALPPSEQPPGPSPLVWIGFGLGGAGLVVGAVTGILSVVRTSDLKAQCEGDVCPASAGADIDSAMLLANVSNVGLAVGGAGVVLGIVGIAISGDGGEGEGEEQGGAARLELAPVIGPGTLGIVGRF
jgi:hypothetical protein